MLPACLLGKGVLRGACAAVLLWVLPGIALGLEIIERFDSDIEIQPNGAMVVTETIRVRAEGVQIRRGIFREFPTQYRDRFGNRVEVDFEVMAARRDGSSEPYHAERYRNGVRVYLGDADRFLQPGTYTYELQYRTNFQLGFFDAYDELYWNATGNGWAFPIARASARIVLPGTVAESEWRLQAYTGAQGMAGADYVASVESSNEVRFASTRLLQAGEGLTIAVGFPKGLIPEPSAAAKILRFLRSNAGILAGIVGLIGLLAFYVGAWRRLGRDPAAGIVIPRYQPPEGYSPASLRYIWRMRYDATAFAAALVNLAVKGKIQISAEKKFLSKRFSVSQDKNKEVDFSPGEAALFKKLLGKRRSFKFEQKHHKRIKGALDAHESALHRDYQKTYFILNRGVITIGFVASAAVLAVMAVLGAFPSAGAIVLIVLMVLLNLLMIRWMKAPTVRGQKLIDQIEGLRLYLGVAERQDLERADKPKPTFEEFERLLPFAVALDCANTWVDRFESELRRLENAGELQNRGWYTGTDQISARGIMGSVNGLSSGLGRSIAASSSAPGSSSGSGGGGFSGGGGGGGGGGGW